MPSVQITRVEKVTADIKAAEMLREHILRGTLAPGTRLTEQHLSQQMDLSRATIRGALQQLSSEGLVSQKPYAGWSVATLDASDAWELSILRAALERTACILVARDLSEDSAQELQKAYDILMDVCDSGTSNEAAEADFALHKTIVSLSGNKRLIHHYTLVEQQIRIFIRSSNALLEEPAVVLEQHRPIVSAILEKDAEKAGRLMEEHTTSEGRKLTEFLKLEDSRRA